MVNHATIPALNDRLISLDAMRGFTIAAMLLVNYPGSWKHIYLPLTHAKWNGLTPTDLIFPAFLFIVGVSIALSYTKLMEKGASKKELYKKIVFRSIKIFAVGVFISLLPRFDFQNVRITGVLQRISVVFLACSFIYLNTSFRTQAWLGVIILILYWLVMTLVPTPGIDEVRLDRDANLAAWVDTMLLPRSVWQGAWDPEGLLGTFPSIVTGISGLLAGRVLLGKHTPHEKSILLMIGGIAAVTAGYIWHLTFPINKNLWSSSFVLVTSGIASLLLGAFYYIVDIRKHASGTKPGIIFGANAIAIYFLSEVISHLFYTLPFGSASLNVHFMSALTHAGLASKLASVLYAITFVCINFLIARILYRKGIFIRL